MWGRLTTVGGQHELTFRGPCFHDPEVDMPHSPAPTVALARQVDAGKAEFRAQLRERRLDPASDGSCDGPTSRRTRDAHDPKVWSC